MALNAISFLVILWIRCAQSAWLNHIPIISILMSPLRIYSSTLRNAYLASYFLIMLINPFINDGLLTEHRRMRYGITSVSQLFAVTKIVQQHAPISSKRLSNILGQNHLYGPFLKRYLILKMKKQQQQQQQQQQQEGTRVLDRSPGGHMLD